METEADTTEVRTNPEETTRIVPEAVADEAYPDESPLGPAGRWFLVAIVLLLVAYPAARWIVTPAGGATAADNATAQVSLQLSFRHIQAGHFEDAVSAAKAVIAVDPKSADAYNNLAVLYMGLHKVDDAIDAVTQALRLRPDYPLAKNNLAWFQQEKAKAAQPQVPAAQEAEAATLLNQSLQHAQARRFKECVDAATQSTRLNPGSAAAFNNLGFCLANLQQWNDAIRDTQEAIRLDPSLQLAKNNLAWMQQEELKAGGPQ